MYSTTALTLIDNTKTRAHTRTRTHTRSHLDAFSRALASSSFAISHSPRMFSHPC